MSQLLVYSCVTGNYDAIDSVLLKSTPKLEPDVKFVLFTDKLSKNESPRLYRGATVEWEIRPLLWSHPICRRRTSRWHKINSHLLPYKHEYSLWLDGSQRIKSVALFREIVEPLYQRFDLASFKHPDRVCVYQEMHACAKLNKDNAKLMQRQIDKYRKEGYPPYNGLVETACVFRKNCPQITEFNRLWWQQIEGHSYRDQLSFNYAAWRLAQPYGRIPGCRAKSLFFDFVPHNAR